MTLSMVDRVTTSLMVVPEMTLSLVTMGWLGIVLLELMLLGLDKTTILPIN